MVSHNPKMTFSEHKCNLFGFYYQTYVVLDLFIYFAPFAALPNWDMWLCMSPTNLLLCFQLPHHANVLVAFLTYSQHVRECQHIAEIDRNGKKGHFCCHF